MPQADQSHTTPCSESDTVATYEIKLAHRSKMLEAEREIIALEAVGETMLLITTSDAFECDGGTSRSLNLMAGIILDECKRLRGRLYE